jgi:hypothetical protein
MSYIICSHTLDLELDLSGGNRQRNILASIVSSRAHQAPSQYHIPEFHQGELHGDLSYNSAVSLLGFTFCQPAVLRKHWRLGMRRYATMTGVTEVLAIIAVQQLLTAS